MAEQPHAEADDSSIDTLESALSAEVIAPHRRKRRKGRIALIAIAVLLVAAASAFIIYVNDYYHAEPVALAAMESGDGVVVTEEQGTVVFMPHQSHAALVFYPGGKVQAESYAPLMRACAKKGILCVLVKPLFNIAFFDADAAGKVIERYPNMKRWYVGGHSLGGVVAAGYAAKHPDTLDGLILLAAYSNDDLSSTDLKTLSLRGGNDLVLDRGKYASAKHLLPEGWLEGVIEGGNHAGFGNYGAQDGDGKATITPEEQQAIAAQDIALLCENAR